MEYKCKMVSAPQLYASSRGFVMPLCESCKIEDCTNPIEKKSICILGVLKKIKVFSRGLEYSFVVQCEGYIQ